MKILLLIARDDYIKSSNNGLLIIGHKNGMSLKEN
jgi:hypothetical protein